MSVWIDFFDSNRDLIFILILAIFLGHATVLLYSNFGLKLSSKDDSSSSSISLPPRREAVDLGQLLELARLCCDDLSKVFRLL